MSWYILYPVVGAKVTRNARVALRKTKPLEPVRGYGFAEGPLKTLKDVSIRLNWMNIPASKRPIRQGRVI
jgi:hypothetical protein